MKSSVQNAAMNLAKTSTFAKSNITKLTNSGARPMSFQTQTAVSQDFDTQETNITSNYDLLQNSPKGWEKDVVSSNLDTMKTFRI